MGENELSNEAVHYRLTVLNAAVICFVLGCAVYTIARYASLSAAEGWGIVYMIGMSGLAVSALIPDLVIQLLVRNRGWQIFFDAIVIIFYGLILVTK